VTEGKIATSPLGTPRSPCLPLDARPCETPLPHGRGPLSPPGAAPCLTWLVQVGCRIAPGLAPESAVGVELASRGRGRVGAEGLVCRPGTDPLRWQPLADVGYMALICGNTI
jgi:hypothetical protein